MTYQALAHSSFHPAYGSSPLSVPRFSPYAPTDHPWPMGAYYLMWFRVSADDGHKAGGVLPFTSK